MKTCPQCHTDNPDSNRFCQQCGRLLHQRTPENATVAIGATVRWAGSSGALPSLKAPMPANVPLADLFGSKDRLVVGRAPDCDVCLPHPMVSRYHAFLERQPDGSLRLSDLASVNGVWVNGIRLTDPVNVGPNQRVGIGPFLFTLLNGIIHTVDSSRSLRLEARNLEKVVRVGQGKTRKLLDDINLVVNPGEFVSLLGPSGSGKSTLMDALNGRRRATGGQVLANGEDFYRHFDNFRQSLGYVPQKDIVHAGLTVFKALYYTARLRLPKDTDPAELRARVEQVLKEMELGPHRDTLIANLSGGQTKRVSLGAELLAQPCLLYIDEATSGLDAGTESRMMRLFRRLADEGRSILCITHNVDNVEQCHLVLLLARGKLMFYGPPQEALGYFGVKRISDVYDRLGEKDPSVWEKQFAASEFHQLYIAQRLAEPAQRLDHSPEVPSGPIPIVIPSPEAEESADKAEAGEAKVEGPAPAPAPSRTRDRLAGLLSDSFRVAALSRLPPLADHIRHLTTRYLRFQNLLSPVYESWHQFRVLLARYLELTFGDRRSLRLLLLQAPVVGIFLLLGFLDRPFQASMPLPREMTAQERAMLTALDAVGAALDEEGTEEKPPPGLERLRFHVTMTDGQQREVTGKEMERLIGDLKDPEGALRRQRDEAKFTVRGVDQEAFQITGKELYQAKQAIKAQDDVRRLLGYRVEQLNPQEKAALEKVQVKVRVKDLEDHTRDHTLNGVELLTMLDRHDQMLDDWRRSHLEDVRVSVPVDGQVEPVVLTGQELLEDLRAFHRNGVADKLLSIKGPILPAGTTINPRYTYTVLFILVMIVIWFGCNNAAKEIVKEEAVYSRERAVNLGIVPYLASKFLVLSFLTAMHSLLLMGVLFGTMHAAHALWPEDFSVPFGGHLVSYPVMFGVLVLLSTTGVALGLLLSACVSTPDRASTLLPYVLIPQMIFGGGFLAVRDGSLMYYVAGVLSPVYWAYRAVRLGAHDEHLKTYPFYSTALEGVGWPCLALAVQTVGLLLLTGWFLRRKDAS
jgi:ABC-type multidrug transport system ATPase subunit